MGLLQISSLSLGPVISLAPTLGVASIAFLSILIVYRVYFHPLAKYPGPFLAKISNLWNLYHAIKCDRPYAFHALHEKYGPYVRVGPNFISTDTPDSLKAIYGMGKNVKKSGFYNPNVNSMFHTSDKKIHTLKRGILQPAFSEKSIKEMEAVILKHTEKFCNIIKAGCDKNGEWRGDVGRWATFLAFDIVSELTFSKDYGMLDQLETTEIPDLLDAHTYTVIIEAVEPLLRDWNLLAWFMPSLKQKRAKFGEYLKAQLSARLSLELKDGEKDFFSYFQNAKNEKGEAVLSIEELSSEAFVLVPAGSETTSSQLSALSFYLTEHPHVQKELARQIRARFPDIKDIVGGPELDNFAYLRAVIDEAFRMSPPAAGVIPREVLEGGLSITETTTGERIVFPEGTEIGITTYALHHNPKFYARPFEFWPERWLENEVGADEVERAKSAFSPFSMGSRVCIGKRLAYVQVSIILARLLWSFELQHVSGALDVARLKQRGVREYKIVDIFSTIRDGPIIKFTKRAT